MLLIALSGLTCVVGKNVKRGPHFHLSLNQSSFIEERERENSHPLAQKRYPKHKKAKTKDPYLSCSDRYTYILILILSRILARDTYLNNTRDITKSHNERDIPDSFRQFLICTTMFSNVNAGQFCSFCSKGKLKKLTAKEPSVKVLGIFGNLQCICINLHS